MDNIVTFYNFLSTDNLQLSQTSLSSHSGLHHRSNTSSPNPYRLSTVSTVSLQDVSDPHAVLEEFRGTQFQQWNTRAIVAWMEVVVGKLHTIESMLLYYRL